MWTHLILAPLIAAASWLYASVGLGGGTAYISLLSLWTSDPATLRPTAWILNILATAIGFANFRRPGRFDLRSAWPFLAGGMAGAGVGGAIAIDRRAFQALLAATLIWAAARMLRPAKRPAGDAAEGRVRLLPALGLGAAVGLLSGLVGIGGGILLGPAILLLGWMDTRKIAPVTSLYILLNSASALLSYYLAGGSRGIDPLPVVALGGAVLIGAYLGSRWGAFRASETALKRIFGLVALAAGIKLFVEFLGGWA